MESIYTIPVNEAFDECRAHPETGCPYCALERMLEERETERILGAAMMEPDVRIKTNELGFCREHYNKMLKRGNRLGLALILESHLDELRSVLKPEGLRAAASTPERRFASIEKLDEDCYICQRVDYNFSKMLETSILLWDREENFREKFASQPYICLSHYKCAGEYAKKRYNKKLFAAYMESADRLVYNYMDTLREDVKWFIKKFDYRYEEEPWGNSKDSVERAIKFLSSDRHGCEK